MTGVRKERPLVARVPPQADLKTRRELAERLADAIEAASAAKLTGRRIDAEVGEGHWLCGRVMRPHNACASTSRVSFERP